MFWMKSLISEWRWRDGYGNVYGAMNLTFRIRTTSVLVSSDSCYPGEERGTHVSILCLLALTLRSRVETSLVRGHMQRASV